MTHEINFDGIVGPTHNYAGLSYGNIASMTNKSAVSSPRDAALQGLAKMKFLHDLGVKQAVLPPHERPHLPTLRRLGFSGSDADILKQVQKDDPTLLAAVSSSSAMWAANAATVSPGDETADGRVHFTPANLITQFHRSIEPETTAAILRSIFADESHFLHHPPLPAVSVFADEGAANHTRLAHPLGHGGIQIFTYGRIGFDPAQSSPLKFPARQTLEASQALARRHVRKCGRRIFVRQSPQAIDAGAFHNDVVCVGHHNIMLIHELAWENFSELRPMIEQRFADLCAADLHIVQVNATELPLSDAVASYLFNSQLVTPADGSIALIAPAEAQENPRSRAVVDRILADDNPIKTVHYVDVRQSMRNGGGPACLRLRVPLTEQQIAATNQAIFLTDELFQTLRDWISHHYRESLSAADLADPKLLEEGRAALDELTRILHLGSIYPFQR